MKNWLILILFLLAGFLHAQKQVAKSLYAKDITYLLVDANNAYRVNLSTNNSGTIRVSALSEGEYQSVLALHVDKEGATAKVATGFQPSFQFPNDKLGAHKVISVSLEISLPQGIEVKVYGKSSNVRATGLFRNLEVVLSDGNCSLEDVKGTVKVQTQQGDISLQAAEGVVDAESRYGKTEPHEFPEGDNLFFLRTISGHISLFKKE